MSGVRLSRGSTVRLLLLAVIWGASFLLIKLALEGLSPMQIVLGRLTFGALALGVVRVARREPLPREPALWGHLLLMAVVANIVPFFLFGWGEQYVTSGMAGILNGATPLFTLVIAMALLPEERLSRLRALGLVVGFAGVVLVVGPWRSGGENTLGGQLACLGAAACYGVSFTYTRRHISGRAGVLALSVAQLAAAAGMMWLAAPAVAWTPVRLTPVVVGSVVALGAVGTGLAYALYYRLIHDAGATTASMVTYLIPIFAVGLGIVVLGEPLTWNLFVGAAVVILGVLVADGRLARRAPAEIDSPVVDAPAAREDDDNGMVHQ